MFARERGMTVVPQQEEEAWEPSQKLQDGVACLARRWSRDDYSQADDLYQEGMLAIWLKG